MATRVASLLSEPLVRFVSRDDGVFGERSDRPECAYTIKMILSPIKIGPAPGFDEAKRVIALTASPRIIFEQVTDFDVSKVELKLSDNADSEDDPGFGRFIYGATGMPDSADKGVSRSDATLVVDRLYQMMAGIA